MRGLDMPIVKDEENKREEHNEDPVHDMNDSIAHDDPSAPLNRTGSDAGNAHNDSHNDSLQGSPNIHNDANIAHN